MNDCSELIEVLRPHLNWHRARLRFLAALVLALIRIGRVNRAQVALGLNPWVQIASNYRLQLPPLPKVSRPFQLRSGNHRAPDSAAITPGHPVPLPPRTESFNPLSTLRFLGLYAA